MQHTAIQVGTATRPVRIIPEPRVSTLAPPASLPPAKTWDGPFGVILVEDNEDEIVSIQRTLKRAGLTDRPHVVRDGRAALDMLLGPSLNNAAVPPVVDVPDVILLDIGLPRVSGLDVLRRVKEDVRVADIPVIVLSGADDEATAQVCMNLGANMYIVKPISSVQVMNIIVAVEKHWLAAENFDAFDLNWRERRAA